MLPAPFTSPPGRDLPAAADETFYNSRTDTLAEAEGNGLAAVNGYYVIGEIGYNPLSNSLGVASSQVGSHNQWRFSLLWRERCGAVPRLPSEHDE